jgi:transcriptional regulator with XRE-family HTH domain
MAIKKERVAERLLELRESHGLSQEDAARRVGITHRQWQRWEQGESMPYPRNLELVANRFGISIREFFDDEVVLRDDDVDVDQLTRLERKLDALLIHAGFNLADFDTEDGAAEIAAAAGEASELLADRPAANASGKRAPARRRRAS